MRKRCIICIFGCTAITTSFISGIILIEHEETAEGYEHLKKALVKQYKYNRDAYTRAKGYFVAEFTQKAKEAYKDKYSV